MIDYTDKQAIYDAIKTADNTQLWSIAGEIAQTVFKANKQLAKNPTDEVITEEYISSLNLDELLSDKSKLRSRVMASLIKGSDQGNHQAADKLAKLAGLESATDELSIECVDYSNALIDCPHCGENVHKPIVADFV
jgi:hypothetical protein